MRRYGRTAALAILASLLAAPACASDFYVGARAGIAHYNFSNVSNNDQAAYGILAGYDFIPWFGVEAEAAKLGGYDGQDVNTGLTFKGTGYALSGVGKLPFADIWEAFVKLGISSTSLDISVPPGYQGISSIDKTGVAIGTGISVRVAKPVQLRFSYDVFAVGGAVSGTASAGTLSIGVLYHF